MMTSGRDGLALREVHRLLSNGTAAALGPGRLLERFALDRDEAAFEALVTRHGPMVLGTCRRILADPHDVDDAFQATFLVLARKAGSIRDADRLGPWLHGVARKIAARSRALSARRNSREHHRDDDPAVDPPNLLEGLELRQVLDDELARLPEKYRAPLVLCYLEGLTHDEAAAHLHWPVGTVRSRLAGGRDRLRVALTRRGLAPSAAVPAILARASIPQALLSATVRLATSSGSPPAQVAALMKGALIAMMWSKLKLVAVVGLMAGLTVGGAGVAAQQGEAGKAPDVPASEKPLEPIRGLLSIDKLRHDDDDDLTGKGLEKEIIRLRLEARAVEKQIGEVRAEQARALRPLQKSLEEFETRSDLLSGRLKMEQAEAASTAVDGRIKALEGMVAGQATAIRFLQGRANRPGGAAAEKPTTENMPKMEAAPEAATPKLAAGPPAEAPPSAIPPAPQPIVHTLNVNSMISSPPLLLVVSAGRDRVTIIDPATKERSSFKLPKGATEIVPIVGYGVISLDIKGPEVTRAAFYDPRDKRWYEYDLGEPATEVSTVTDGSLVALRIKGKSVGRVAVLDPSEKKWSTQLLQEPAVLGISPMVTSTVVTYRKGRFLYKYSSIAKKWSVLGLKQHWQAWNLISQSGDGSETIQDGDAIRIYDPKTGEWTHIDIKDDK